MVLFLIHIPINKEEQISVPEDAPPTSLLIKKAELILEKFEIENVNWVLDCHRTTYQVTFPCLWDSKEILQELLNLGLGCDFGSISVLPVDITRPSFKDYTLRDKKSGKTDEADKDEALIINTIRSALAIEKIIDETAKGAVLTFDYCTLILMAAIVAGVGLASNNVAAIIAAMLISPLMGPILGLSFGTTMNDRNLTRHSFISCCVGLVICFITGLLIGLIAPLFPKMAAAWPTPEMYSRGTIDAQFIGIAIATPSGIAVALSVLSSSVSVLVGVAISAALLPPAVNGGMNIAFSFVGPLASRHSFLVIGGYSFLLSLINILIIYLTSIIMFKIREVAPIPGESSREYRKEMHEAKQYIQTIQKGDTKNDLVRALQKRDVTGIPFEVTNQDTSRILGNLLRTQQSIQRSGSPHVTAARGNHQAGGNHLQDLFRPPLLKTRSSTNDPKSRISSSVRFIDETKVSTPTGIMNSATFSSNV